MGLPRAAKCWRLLRRFTIGLSSSQQTAEHRTLDDPSFAEHVADFAVARRIAVARLAAFAVVVQTNDRHAVGGAKLIHRRLGVERQTFEHTEGTGLDIRAFAGGDCEEMRVRS